MRTSASSSRPMRTAPTAGSGCVSKTLGAITVRCSTPAEAVFEPPPPALDWWTVGAGIG